VLLQHTHPVVGSIQAQVFIASLLVPLMGSATQPGMTKFAQACINGRRCSSKSVRFDLVLDGVG
jgi:hypothetical protein